MRPFVMNRLNFAATIATVFALAGSAYAQGIAVSAAYGTPFYGGSHASTAAEGYANGMAAMVQSAGSYNLNTSQAAMNLESARSQALDNDLKGTQTYFEMRNINTTQRKAEEGARCRAKKHGGTLRWPCPSDWRRRSSIR